MHTDRRLEEAGQKFSVTRERIRPMRGGGWTISEPGGIEAEAFEWAE
jgi:hypothetical protein